MPREKKIEYTSDVIAEMEWMFSEDFLSPGGVDEVAKIVEGIRIAGKSVLDLGVGVGGPACALVENHDAAHVMGIDIEQPVLDKAAALVARRGLGDRITLKRVARGKLSFDDKSFDVVFSKDSIVHIPNKLALFKEAYRVLKPGGWLVMSDWYCSDQPFTREMTDWVDETDLSFALAPIANDAAFLAKAGFVDCTTLDRNAWFTDYTTKSVGRLRKTDYAMIVAELGQEDADLLLSQAKKRALISGQGQLRLGHLRGRKPA